jgi:hypothetical protein
LLGISGEEVKENAKKTLHGSKIGRRRVASLQGGRPTDTST